MDKPGANIARKLNKRSEFFLKSWWTKRSKLERRLIFVSIVFFIILIASVLLYVFLIRQPKTCEASTCVHTAMELLNHIDPKMNPCDDFYKFSCGNFLKNTNLDNQGSRSVHDIMREEIQSQIRIALEQPIRDDESTTGGGFNLAKKFYRACMDENTVESRGLFSIRQIFDDIGGWPVLDDETWSENDFDWKKSVHKLRQIGINFEFLITLGIERDRLDPSKYILKLKDPYYDAPEISENSKKVYRDYMADIAVYFGSDRDIASRDQRDVFDFLMELAKISQESKLRNKTILYNPLSLSELQHKYRRINWYEYINGILAPVSQVNYDDIITVSEPYYLERLEVLLLETPKRVLANFIAWHTLQHLINFLPTEALNRAYTFLDEINEEVFKKPPRWVMCVEATKKRLGSVISASYIQKYFDDTTRFEVMELVKGIKEQFRITLRHLEWIDKETRDLTIKKLVSSSEDLASYDDLVQNIERNNIYNKVQPDENNLLKFALKLDFVNLNKEFGKLHQPVRVNWFENPSFVTGLDIIFSPKDNTLRFPIGILSGLYYQKDRPKYMNFGALGSIIAHEVWHTLIEAEYRNLKGDLRRWWTPTTLLNYEKRLQCLSRQYRRLTLPDSEIHVDTENTRDEDMADLVGLKVVYDTYQTYVYEKGVEPRLPGLNYSPNQLFWISSAVHYCSKYATRSLERNTGNRHSPEAFRVNGPLQNLKEFSYDFGCGYDDKMNPEDKCDDVI